MEPRQLKQCKQGAPGEIRTGFEFASGEFKGIWFELTNLKSGTQKIVKQ